MSETTASRCYRLLTQEEELEIAADGFSVTGGVLILWSYPDGEIAAYAPGAWRSINEVANG